MGHKVHPKIFRTGVIYSWDSKWFAGLGKDYPGKLQEDHMIREYLKKVLKDASVDHVEIERTPRAMTVTIYSAKPGFIIGRGGTGVEDLKKNLAKQLTKVKKGAKVNLNVNIIEVNNPSLSAEIVQQSMIADLERRMPFRRVLKQHMDRVQKAGAKGVKMIVKGRLNGAEIARAEKLSWGSVPLHNLRADISYSSGFARTLFGAIGVKVWIYRGEIFGDQEVVAPAAEKAPEPMRAKRTRKAPAAGAERGRGAKKE